MLKKTCFPLILLLTTLLVAVFSVNYMPLPKSHADDAAIQAELEKLKAESIERQKKLEGELSGVNDSIKSLILEIDDLQNNQIAEVTIRLTAANAKLKECRDKTEALQKRLDAAQAEKAKIQEMLDVATAQYVGAKVAMGSLAREEMQSSPDQITAAFIFDSGNSEQFVENLQRNDTLEKISSRIMRKAGEKQAVYTSKSQRLDAVNQKISEIKKEADENEKKAAAAQAEVAAENNKLQAIKRDLQGKQKELEKKRGELATRIQRTEEETANIDLQMQLLAMGVFGQMQVSIGGFVPGYLISDGNFYTSGTMSVDAIQSFLNIWGAKCNGSQCLKNKRVVSINGSNDAQCSGSAPGREMSMAQAISEVSHACQISEKVLLVTIQKEQGLVTRDAEPADWRYKSMLGYGCPDGGACDPNYAAAYYQLYAAAWQFKKYRNAAALYRFHARQNNYIPFHPNSGCGGKDMMIANDATAGLYNYTPYTPNDSALAAGFGTGDGCSSYGNRNFFLYYKGWFGSPI